MTIIDTTANLGLKKPHESNSPRGIDVPSLRESLDILDAQIPLRDAAVLDRAPGGVLAGRYANTLAGLNQGLALALAEKRRLIIDRVIPLAASFADNHPNAPAEAIEIMPGGGFQQAGAAAVTIRGRLIAGRHNIFKGFTAPQIGFEVGVAPIVLPDWFYEHEIDLGAWQRAITLAAAKCNKAVVQLEAGTYALTGNATNVDVIQSESGLLGRGLTKTILNRTGVAAGGALRWTGVEGTPLRGLDIGQMTIDRSGALDINGGVGLDLAYTHGAHVHDMQINNHLAPFKIKRCTNLRMVRVHAHYEGPATCGAFEIDGSGGVIGALGNASAVFEDVSASRAIPDLNSIAFSIFGTGLNAYCGDLTLNRIDTQGYGVGVKVNLTGTAALSSGNADIMFLLARLDGFTNVALICEGDTDEFSLVSFENCWLNPHDSGLYTGMIAMLIRDGFGGVFKGAQLGIGGRGKATGAHLLNRKHTKLTELQAKNWLKGVVIENCEDCEIGESSLFRNKAAYPAQFWAHFKGTTARCRFKPGSMSGYVSGHPVLLDATTAGNEVSLPACDATNFPTWSLHGQTRNFAVDVSGTGNRVSVKGPPWLVKNAGTGTLIWSEWGDYPNPTIGRTAGTGDYVTTSVTARWRYDGGDVEVDCEITLTDPGLAAGLVTFQLPVAAHATQIACLCTGQTHDFAKTVVGGIVNGALRLRGDDGSSLIAAGAIIRFRLRYRRA